MKSSIRIYLAIFIVGTVFLLGRTSMTQAADGAFVLTVDPPGQTAHVGQTITISGYVPGAEGFDYYISHDGGDPENIDYFPDVERFVDQYSFAEAGEYDIFAIAYFPNEEEIESEHYIIRVDMVDPAEFNVPDTVEKGAVLPVEITSLGNAEQFQVRIIDEGNNDILYTPVYDSMEMPAECTLFTGSLRVGAQYYVVIDAYTQGLPIYTTNRELHPLQVTESETNIRVALNRTSLMAGETIRYSVYAHDAEEVKLKVLNSEGGVVDETDFEGDYAENAFYLENAGTYTVYGGARYPGQNTWVYSEDTITLTVTSLGILPAPLQTWPSIVMAGEDISYFFDAVENADYYIQMLYIPGVDKGSDIPVIPGSNDIETKDMESGVVYGLEVIAHGVGYTSSISNPYPVAVVDPDKVLTLPSGLKTIESEAFMGVDAQLVVLPEGVTSVAPRAFANCPNLIAVVSPNGALQLDDNVFEGCPNEVVIAESY